MPSPSRGRRRGDGSGRATANRGMTNNSLAACLLATAADDSVRCRRAVLERSWGREGTECGYSVVCTFSGWPSPGRIRRTRREREPERLVIINDRHQLSPMGTADILQGTVRGGGPPRNCNVWGGRGLPSL
jgi:hypothetical protein